MRNLLIKLQPECKFGILLKGSHVNFIASRPPAIMSLALFPLTSTLRSLRIASETKSYALPIITRFSVYSTG